MGWVVYLLQCADNSLYTGITTDLERRLHEHNHGRAGARYTRARRPVSLAYFEEAADRSAASQREYRLRKQPASTKRELARADRQAWPEKYAAYAADVGE